MSELHRELGAKIEEVTNALGHFIADINLATDPITPLLSDKGVWLIRCPFVNTKALMRHISRLFASDLAERSTGLYRVTQARVSKDRFEFVVAHGDREICTWSVLNSDVSVPHFNEILGIRKAIDAVAHELNQIKTEMRDVAVVVNSKDAMLMNGYYTLYLRATFQRKKFREHVKEIEGEFRAQIAEKKAELKQLETRLAELNQDNVVTKALNFLSNHYLKFPRIKNLDAYERHIKQEEVPSDGKR